MDPRYALAYFGLAEAYRALAITSDVRPKDTLPQAKAAATKALEIDESLAEPHASLVFIRMWFDRDWVGAETDGKRALELNPNSGFAHIAYAHLLSDLGRHEEAVAQAARARELDPVSLIINAIEGSVLYYARREMKRARGCKRRSNWIRTSGLHIFSSVKFICRRERIRKPSLSLARRENFPGEIQKPFQ